MKVKELKQVVNVFRELSQLYIIKRDKPAYKTGNLYKRVGSYNNINNMVTQRPSRGKNKLKLDIDNINISLSFAPPGALYGRYVHEGTKYMAARPFAKEAANDKRMQTVIDKAMKGVVRDNVIPDIRKRIDKAFKKFKPK
jgi:hypothetical protein